MKWVCVILILFASRTQAQDVHVMRWSTQESVLAESVSMSLQGIVVKAEGEDLPFTIPWYDFRSTDRPLADYADWMQVHDDAWRAHTRLLRGDYSGAEKMYDQLRDQYLWKIGPESVDVSLGLARTSLEADDRAGAVIPFLSWNVAIGSSNEKTIGHVDGLDRQYDLMISMPPIFAEPADSVKLEISSKYEKHFRVEPLALIYQLAHNRSLHRTDDAENTLSAVARLLRTQDRKDAGVAFMLEMANAMYHPDQQRRVAMRAALARRKRVSQGTWVEVWSRLAIGSSLLSEQETQLNELGAIELIHIIVRLSDISPSLSQLAAQVVNAYLVETNQEDWGAQLLLLARENAMGIPHGIQKDILIDD